LSQKRAWLRVLAESLAIVASILLAFGIDAWWDAKQERTEERELLADLAAEIRWNRALLDSVTTWHRDRAEVTKVIIREAGPDREGLSADSLAKLATATYRSPTYFPDKGVITRALSGSGLSLISDPDLRTEIAGFWDRFEPYFRNQMFAPEIWSQTLWTSGSLLHPSVPRWESMGPSTMWSARLTPEEVVALKYFALRLDMDEILAAQAAQLFTAMDSLLVRLNWALEQ
jgi:hypothetical protein